MGEGEFQGICFIFLLFSQQILKLLRIWCIILKWFNAHSTIYAYFQRRTVYNLGWRIPVHLPWSRLRGLNVRKKIFLRFNGSSGIVIWEGNYCYVSTRAVQHMQIELCRLGYCGNWFDRYLYPLDARFRGYEVHAGGDIERFRHLWKRRIHWLGDNCCT